MTSVNDNAPVADELPSFDEPVALDTVEYERQLVGHVFANPATASEVVLALPPEHMSSGGHAAMWTLAVERAYAGYRDADPVAVMHELAHRHPEYPKIGERARKYILDYGVAPNVPFVAGTLVEEVSRGHAARETQQGLIRAWQALNSGHPDTAREIMSSIDPNAGSRDRWHTLSDAWAAAKVDAENPAAIIPTPWAQMNRYFEGGMRSRQVYVLAGLAGAGKTASAQQVVDHAASDGRTVAVFSLEMGETDLARRQMATSGGVAMGEVMRPDLRMTKDAVAAADGVLERIGERVLIDDSEELTVRELRTRARVAVRRHKAELIVVDYAQLVDHDNDKLSERETISAVVKEIARMAKELQVPVLLLAQPNRNASYQDRKLEITDLYGSGALEKFAAGVVLLNKVMDTDDEGNKIATECIDFDVKKNRFGQADVTCRMLGDLSRQRFEELSK